MTGILLALSYTALLLFAMGRFRFFTAVPHLPLRTLRWLFLLKVAAGMALWAVYTYAYPDRSTADIFKYFDDSFHMFKALPEHPMDFLRMFFGYGNDTPEFQHAYYQQMNNWERQFESGLYNDAHTIIRFNAAVRLVSFGEFHVHTVFAAFLSFLGSVGIYRVFVARLVGKERLLMAAIFLVPSVLFWSSGVIKESLLFFGLGLLLNQLHVLGKGMWRWYDPVLALFALALLVLLKFYVLLSMLPALLFYLWSRSTHGWATIRRAGMIYILFCAIGLNLPLLFPGTNILAILATKQRDFVGLAHLMNSGSFVMPTLLEPTIGAFVSQAPYALYITLFGPLAHPGPGAFGAAAAVENTAIALLVLMCLVYCRRLRTIDLPLVLALLGYCAVLALVIGWTTPVMGAVVRYRTPLAPFLLILALYLVDLERILAPWPRLRQLLAPGGASSAAS